MANKYSDTILRALLQVLFVLVWGFAGIGKARAGLQTPAWFVEKFQASCLQSFPGLLASYVGIMGLELACFAVMLISLLRGECFPARRPYFLHTGLVLSLATFVALLFGLQLTGDHAGVATLFQYGAGTLVALVWLESRERGRR